LTAAESISASQLSPSLTGKHPPHSRALLPSAYLYFAVHFATATAADKQMPDAKKYAMVFSQDEKGVGQAAGTTAT